MPRVDYQENATYMATVVAQGFSESENAHTPFFFLEISIDSLDGEQVERGYNQEVRRYLTDKTFEFFTQDLAALGFTWKKSISDIDPGTPWHHSFVGSQIAVYCKYEGEYPKWSISRPKAHNTYQPLPSNKLRQLDSLFGKAMKSGPASAPRPTVPSQYAVGVDEDSIPF